MIPKRTFLLLIGVIVIVFALAISMPGKSEAPTLPNQPPSSTAAPVGKTVLSLSPNPVIIERIGASQILNVNIQTNEEKITAVQLELSFDPKMITNVNIVPGTFFTNPNVLLKEIDSTNGRISYAIGIAPTGQTSTGTGIVANISFTPVGKNQSTQMTFLQKTLTTAEGVSQSTLKSATGATIVLPK